MANPACSYAKYSTGNRATLETAPLALAPPVEAHKVMKAFHAEHYGPSNLGLVVVSALPLDRLEAMVAARFEVVPARAAAPQPQPLLLPPLAEEIGGAGAGGGGGEAVAVPVLPPLLDASKLPLTVKFAPLRELRRLTLVWEVPARQGTERRHWDAPPARLWSHLLGHEGPGSAFAYLQDRGWATALSAGNKVDQADCAAFQVKTHARTKKNLAKRCITPPHPPTLFQ